MNDVLLKVIFTELQVISVSLTCDFASEGSAVGVRKLVIDLFVCLHTRSVWRHTWVLMGPDSNKLLKSGFTSLYKYADLVFYGNKREKKIKVKGKRREKPWPLALKKIKSNNFTVSPSDTKADKGDKKQEIMKQSCKLFI